MILEAQRRNHPTIDATASPLHLKDMTGAPTSDNTWPHRAPDPPWTRTTDREHEPSHRTSPRVRTTGVGPILASARERAMQTTSAALNHPHDHDDTDEHLELAFDTPRAYNEVITTS